MANKTEYILKNASSVIVHKKPVQPIYSLLQASGRWFKDVHWRCGLPKAFQLAKCTGTDYLPKWIRRRFHCPQTHCIRPLNKQTSFAAPVRQQRTTLSLVDNF